VMTFITVVMVSVTVLMGFISIVMVPISTVMFSISTVMGEESTMENLLLILLFFPAVLSVFLYEERKKKWKAK
jgi:Na+/melibiose symporter-like transporter